MSYQKEKLEIKHIKLKMLLGILVILGSLLAFLMDNKNIYNDFFSSTVFILKYNKNDYNLIIRMEKNKKIIDYPFSIAKKGIKIISGNYKIKILYFDNIIWEDNFYMEKGIKNALKIPDFIGNKIRVIVKNYTPSPNRGEPLSIEVRSSGNGCLWIYDIKSNLFNKIFPKNNSCYKITSDVTIRDINLISSETEDKDVIVFLVTASQSLDDANKIMQSQFSHTIEKSSLNISKTDWGVYVLEYPIKHL